MMDEKKPRVPVCPSCGQPVRFGFLRFRISDKAKAILALFLIGCFILSLLIMIVINPREPGSGKRCRRYDYIHQPDWRKDTEFKVPVRPLNDAPALQVFVGIGLAMGRSYSIGIGCKNFMKTGAGSRGRSGRKTKKDIHVGTADGSGIRSGRLLQLWGKIDTSFHMKRARYERLSPYHTGMFRESIANRTATGSSKLFPSAGSGRPGD
jgi:hypothetical protein